MARRIKKLTPNQAQWQKEIERILRFQREAEGRGYYFPPDIVPQKPKKVTKKSLQKLKDLTPDAQYEQAQKLNTETGELEPGDVARKRERSEAAKKGWKTRLANQKKREREEKEKQKKESAERDQYKPEPRPQESNEPTGEEQEPDLDSSFTEPVTPKTEEEKTEDSEPKDSKPETPKDTPSENLFSTSKIDAVTQALANMRPLNMQGSRDAYQLVIYQCNECRKTWNNTVVNHRDNLEELEDYLNSPIAEIMYHIDIVIYESNQQIVLASLDKLMVFLNKQAPHSTETLKNFESPEYDIPDDDYHLPYDDEF